MNKEKKNYIFYISIIFMILLWHIISLIVNSEILLPSPIQTFQRFINMIKNTEFWLAVWHTIYRGLISLSIVIIIGVSLGLLMGFKKGARMFFTPYIKLMQSIPPVSWIIIAIIWVNYNVVPIFVMCIAILPIMTTTTMEGIKDLDQKIIDMTILYKLSKRTKLKVYIGSILPYVLSGITLCLGQAWKIAAIAEILSNPQYGIGVELKWTMSNLAIVDTFVWTISIVLISAIFNKILSILRNRIERWKNK
ncbi:MAG: ABC transporter permease [Spirochaetota bacterium]